jgi:hypothetical protein
MLSAPLTVGAKVAVGAYYGTEWRGSLGVVTAVDPRLTVEVDGQLREFLGQVSVDRPKVLLFDPEEVQQHLDRRATDAVRALLTKIDECKVGDGHAVSVRDKVEILALAQAIPAN